MKKIYENKMSGLKTWELSREEENILLDNISNIRKYKGFEEFHPYITPRGVRRNKKNKLTFKSGVGYEILADLFGVPCDGRVTKMLNELEINFQ